MWSDETEIGEECGKDSKWGEWDQLARMKQIWDEPVGRILACGNTTSFVVGVQEASKRS